MEELIALLVKLNPLYVGIIGLLVSLFRMLMNGMLYKNVNEFENDLYFEGLPFQWMKFFTVLIATLVLMAGYVILPYNQVAQMSAIAIAFNTASITYDIGKLTKLYLYLKKKDNYHFENEEGEE